MYQTHTKQKYSYVNNEEWQKQKYLVIHMYVFSLEQQKCYDFKCCKAVLDTAQYDK